MEVNFNPSLSVNTGSGQLVVRQNNIQPADTTMSFDRTQALEKTLQQATPVRPEVVAKASALVADENYPSDSVLNQMAGLLSSKLGQSNTGPG
jgi:hypothetical protein